MIKLWRKRFAIAAILLFLGAAFSFIGTYAVGSALTAPRLREVTPPSDKLPVESVHFPSESGGTVAGWFIPAADAERAVLLLHPLRATRRAMWSRADYLWDAGYAVLLIDFQAHGESPGERLTFGHLESRDARAAVAFLRERMPHAAIAVNGVSLGAASVMLAEPPLDVQALILEAPYSTVEEATRNRVRKYAGSLSATVLTPLLLMQLKPRLGIALDDLRPIDGLRKVRAPVLLIAGGEDQRTTPEQSKQIFDAAPEPKEFWLIEGVAHVDFHRFKGEEYERRVLGFLEKQLRP